jgi:two-component system chemotaxis response regulator CheY
MCLIEVKMARIMIADDSELVRSTLKDMLELGKHQVVSEAVDGVDTLEKFDSVNPDVLLLDIAMPKKDGVETLIQIMKSNPNAKVIMITAHYDMELIENCINIGSLAYISKPFSSDDILHSISYALETK